MLIKQTQDEWLAEKKKQSEIKWSTQCKLRHEYEYGEKATTTKVENTLQHTVGSSNRKPKTKRNDH